MTKTFKEEFQLVRERNLSTDELVMETYRDKEGRLHGGLTDPAVIKYAPGEKPYHFEYWHHGLEHRLDGEPSTITIDPDTDVIIFERYCEGGEKHRARHSGPAIIRRDPKTGAVLETEYHEISARLESNDFNNEPR